MRVHGARMFLAAAVAGAVVMAGQAFVVAQTAQAQTVEKNFTGIAKSGKSYRVYKRGKLLTKSGKVGKR